MNIHCATVSDTPRVLRSRVSTVGLVIGLVLFGAAAKATAQPTITMSPAGNQSAVINQTINYSTTCHDPSGQMDCVAFFWQDPQGHQSWDGSTGTPVGLSFSGATSQWSNPETDASWSVGVTPTQVGTYLVKWGIHEASGPNAGWVFGTTYELVVTNTSITMSPAGDQSIALNGSITYSTNCTDPSGQMDCVAFFWQDPQGHQSWDGSTGTPVGLTFSGPTSQWSNPETNASWSVGVTATQVGTYYVKWGIHEASGPNAGWIFGTTYQLVVTQTSQPTITMSPAGNQTATTGQTITYSTNCHDPSGQMDCVAFFWQDPQGHESWDGSTGTPTGLNFSGPTSQWSNPETDASWSVGVTPAQAGTYIVKWGIHEASGPNAGWVFGDAYQLVVSDSTSQAPGITSQPQSQTVSAGSSASFSVTATGSAPLSYQWQKNNTAISGATTSTYTIASAQSGDAGNYNVVVSNSAGSITSNTATLTVTTSPVAPTITAQPQSQTASAGSTATFSVTASGTTPFTYQWSKDGAALSGATQQTLTISNVQAANAGNYTVVVTNAAGSATSNPATLTVGATSAPQIKDQPMSQSVNATDPVIFSVTATGTPPFTYQWRKDGTALTGQKLDTLPIQSVQASDAGNYTVVVTTPNGSVTSNAAVLTVNTGAPTITVQPVGSTVNVGDNASFTVVATGTGPLTYHWLKDGHNVSQSTVDNTNYAVFTVPNAQPRNGGGYSVVVSNQYGSATSNVATLTVNGSVASTQIVDVHTAAPNIVVVDVQSPIEYIRTSTAPQPDYQAGDPVLATSSWQVTQGSQTSNPSSVYLYSVPWDQLPAVHWLDLPQSQPGDSNDDTIPVTVRHRFYLVLNSDLVDQQSYTLSTPFGPTSFTLRTTGDSATATYCESIKVNQVGYSKLNPTPFANFGVFMGDGHTAAVNGGVTYKVVDETTGNTVKDLATVTAMTDDTGSGPTNSGEYVYQLSLAGVPPGGPYYISVQNAGRSRSFKIGDAASQYLAMVTMRGMYLHRCGMALTKTATDYTHAACHNYVALDTQSTAQQDEVTATGPFSFIQGGYHDAGDMDHPDTHPIISIAMLSFYEAFPSHFVDGQYNIAESGNGIPDFLDEAMWGVKLWEHLQRSDGSVMAGWSTNGATGYGIEDAANDTHTYGTFSVNRDDGTGFVSPRNTELAAGIFAQASRLIRPYDSAKADELEQRAEAAWGYLQSINTDFSKANYCIMYAALQLFLNTSGADYHNIFTSQANAIVLSIGSYPNQYIEGDFTACQTAHFISYVTANNPNKNPDLVSSLKTAVVNYIEKPTQDVPTKPGDTPYPCGIVPKFGLRWGSATTQGRAAQVYMYATLCSGDSTKIQTYTNIVAQYADFSLGLNPMGMSYYTGLGTDQPNSPLDCNSYFTKYGFSDGVTRLADGTLDPHVGANGLPLGNVPGIVVFGPTEDTPVGYEQAIENKIYPAVAQLPPQRWYAHGEAWVKANEFTVWQTMVWNALMYSFLYTPPPQ